MSIIIIIIVMIIINNNNNNNNNNVKNNNNNNNNMYDGHNKQLLDRWMYGSMLAGWYSQSFSGCCVSDFIYTCTQYSPSFRPFLL